MRWIAVAIAVVTVLAATGELRVTTVKGVSPEQQITELCTGRDGVRSYGWPFVVCSDGTVHDIRQ